MSNSPIHMTKYEGIVFNTNNTAAAIANPIGINSVSSSNSNMKMMDQNVLSPQTPQQQLVETEDFNNSCGLPSAPIITKDSTPAHLAQWMNFCRLGQYVSTFAHFSGADLLRMSKEDLIQICGLADGIRMYNTLHSK